MRSYTKEEMQSVIMHELGHWVVARELGYNVGGIEIIFHNIGGRCNHNAHANILAQPSLPRIDDVYKYALDRISILYAGAASQKFRSKNLAREVEKLSENDAADDFSKLNEFVIIARGIAFKDQIHDESETEQKLKICDECWQKTMEILDRMYSKIEIASDIMLQRAKKENFRHYFTFDDVLKALEKE
jgi:hypothetical protein